MEKNETRLTAEVYEGIMNDLVKNIVELKKQQGETIDRISVIKEVLITYKAQLKDVKKNIAKTKKNLRREKSDLKKINDTLNTRNHSITELNYAITSEEERTIDLNEFSSTQSKKR